MASESFKVREVMLNGWKYFALPVLFFTISFIVLTYPLILSFETHFFTDDGDGLMGVWNLWWVERVVTHPIEYSTFWHTDMLHQPFGITLLGHTLTPFNGLLASLLTRFMPLLEAHNLIVIFSFVMSGLTAYWLGYYFSRSVFGSLIAGWLFTFSAYHFTHFDGHLNLITLEWIPLFVLCFYVLANKPGSFAGVAAAVSLWLVLLSDFYYLFYCLLLGGLIVLGRMIQMKDIFFPFRNNHAIPFGIFGVLSVILLAPVVFPLVLAAIRSPFLGGHDPAEFSLDLLSILIPGERWRFGEWTRFLWTNLPGDPAEISVFPGWSLLLFVVYLFMSRKSFDDETRWRVKIWFACWLVFLIMALGPVLHVGGMNTGIPMPYALLERFVPFIEMSGVPVRMIIMAVLAGSVLFAMGIRKLTSAEPSRKALIALILLLVIFETLPAPLPATSVEAPGYVKFLAGLPEGEIVLDRAASNQYLHLFYQTLHEKPLVFGYTARIPSSLYKREKDIRDAIGAGDYRILWQEYRIRYIATQERIEVFDPVMDVQLIYDEDGVRIYRLGTR